MGVFSDDFATVDVREELCYHSRPKKQIQEVHGTGIKPMKESIARRKKRQPIPKRVSGDGSAPPRFRFGFPVISFPWRVLGCGERSEPHLSMPSTRHGATSVFPLFSAPFLSCVQSEFSHNKTAPCGAALEVNLSSCFFRPDSRNAVYITPIVTVVCRAVCVERRLTFAIAVYRSRG